MYNYSHRENYCPSGHFNTFAYGKLNWPFWIQHPSYFRCVATTFKYLIQNLCNDFKREANFENLWALKSAKTAFYILAINQKIIKSQWEAILIIDHFYMTSWSTNINYTCMSKQCWLAASEDSGPLIYSFIPFWKSVNGRDDFQVLNTNTTIWCTVEIASMSLYFDNRENAYILTCFILRLPPLSS